jgi:hypothetical protein
MKVLLLLRLLSLLYMGRLQAQKPAAGRGVGLYTTRAVLFPALYGVPLSRTSSKYSPAVGRCWEPATVTAVVGRGSWARVTIGQFRHWALQTFTKHRAPANIFFIFF